LSTLQDNKVIFACSVCSDGDVVVITDGFCHMTRMCCLSAGDPPCLDLQCASQAIAAVLELYAAGDWVALR
jgi:hypothetical protein